ncbi:MAG: PLP-dependent aminotransferase family protein [Veillonellales bacterium]
MKYNQIINYLQTEINSKRLHSGDRIPSIREMALLFHCSKATVIRAYRELEDKHILYSIPKSGYFVVNNSQIQPSNLSFIDFASMMPETAIIPYWEFRHCINQSLDVYQEKSLMYNEKQGLPALRTALARQLQDVQIFEKPENIYITAGAQQTIDILVRMPFPNGKTTVLVEQPTYAGILKSLRNSGVTAIGIRRNYNGISFDKLESFFKNGNIKFFYTMPRYQNPTGASYSGKEKEAILALARKYDVYIVEDDYLAEFNADAKTDPLYAMDNSEHIIYVKSYSKVCLPGLRLGAVLLPQSFRNVFLEYKCCVDPYTSAILQGAFAMFLKNGMYTHHVKKMNHFYYSRIAALAHACKQLPPEATWQHSSHCPLIFVELPEQISFPRIAASLQTKNILLQGGDIWYLPNFEQKNGIRLCVYQTDEAQISAGISSITDAINYQLSQKAARPPEFSYEI